MSSGGRVWDVSRRVRTKGRSRHAARGVTEGDVAGAHWLAPQHNFVKTTLLTFSFNLDRRARQGSCQALAFVLQLAVRSRHRRLR